MNTVKHASLFSGFGAPDIAAEWMGWENVFWCEKNKFCQRILKYYWPQAEGYEDITTTDFTIYRGQVDVLTGGFPCQPFSVAGKQLGTEDDRHLWPEYRRAIREIQPGIVVAENVAGLFGILEPASLSEVESKEIQLFSESEDYQVNATIERIQRRVIATIIEEIRAEGYFLPTLEDGTPVICCIPAAGVNAPHRRDRIWIVAYHNSRGGGNASNTNKDGHRGNNQFTEVRCEKEEGSELKNQRQRVRSNVRGISPAEITTDTECERGIQIHEIKNEHRTEQQITNTINERNDWTIFPTQSPLCGGDDGLPSELDGITFSKWRAESIMGYGNAMVPELVYRIYKAIDLTGLTIMNKAL